MSIQFCTLRARELYKRLLQRTQHVKVWLSFAQFELQLEHDDAMAQARHVYREANNALRRSQDKEERLMLLETWRDFEQENGGEEEKREVGGLMPRRIKRRRKIQTEDGSDGGWEEYFDYIFPEDEAAKPNLKLLAMAKMWKKQKAVEPAEDEDDGGERTASENGNEESGEGEEPVVEVVDTDINDIVREAEEGVDQDNPDADDPDIVNESDSSDDEPDEKRTRTESPT